MQPDKRPLIIGITGNIGSGKSTFCHILESRGYTIHYTDQLANRHLEDEQVVQGLIARYGKQVLIPDTSVVNAAAVIDKTKLAKLVFSNANKLKHLNSLLHPLVLKDMQALVESSVSEAVIFEIPLLFEAGLQDSFDFIVLISAPREIRLQRIIRRGLSPQDAEKRIQNQMDDDIKSSQSHLLIVNDGDIAHIDKEADLLNRMLKNIEHKQIRPFS